ncbi:MAG TPA: hypothetical protein DEA22_13010 [Blastocatellia bacterium]|nr:hypothetical protein [Blastocatellia bacterium]
MRGIPVKNGFILIAGVLIASGALIGGLFGRLPSSISADSSVTAGRIVADYREALDVIEKNHVGTLNREELTESSIQGMLWSLDPHSQFFTRDEFRKLSEEQSSQFYGIGVSILQHRDGVYVESVIPNTPADKAGIRYGDRFVSVDGKSATEWSSAEVSNNVRGERGTTVKVRVERVSSPAPLDFDIVRGGVPLPSIRNYFMLPNGVGYIGLVGGFQETTSEELDNAISELGKKGMSSLILDLRGNPGGLLPQAIDVVGKFIPQGNIVVTVKGRTRYSRTQELKVKNGPTANFPVVVLINGNSASASEIVAGALQDYGRALVVGTDSFGKGLVQRVFPLPYGTGLTLTAARYYTPFGRSLQRDYSNGSIYDYYTHQNGEINGASEAPRPKPAGSPVTLPDGRVLYGGRGIEPDIRIETPEFTALRYRLNDAAFFFTRRLVGGRVAGFEDLRVEKQNYQYTVAHGEFQITDKLFDAFRNYALSVKENGLTAENISSNTDYLKTRLRQELATAHYSNEAGTQVLLEVDPQVLGAIEAMPQARMLADRNLARGR